MTTQTSSKCTGWIVGEEGKISFERNKIHTEQTKILVKIDKFEKMDIFQIT